MKKKLFASLLLCALFAQLAIQQTPRASVSAQNTANRGGQSLPLVAVLSTGGTIVSRYDATKGGFVQALSGDQLVEAVPEIKKVARIRVEEVSNIGSSEMTPEIWLKLVKRANELLAAPFKKKTNLSLPGRQSVWRGRIGRGVFGFG